MKNRTLGNAGLEVSAIGYEENLGAVNVTLTVDDLHEIEAAASRITVQGARLPEAVLKLSNR